MLEYRSPWPTARRSERVHSAFQQRQRSARVRTRARPPAAFMRSSDTDVTQPTPVIQSIRVIVVSSGQTPFNWYTPYGPARRRFVGDYQDISVVGLNWTAQCRPRHAETITYLLSTAARHGRFSQTACQLSQLSNVISGFYDCKLCIVSCSDNAVTRYKKLVNTKLTCTETRRWAEHNDRLIAKFLNALTVSHLSTASRNNSFFSGDIYSKLRSTLCTLISFIHSFIL